MTDLVAGPELDARVARALGCEPAIAHGAPWIAEMFCLCDGTAHGWPMGVPLPPGRRDQAIIPYSTDGSAAASALDLLGAASWAIQYDRDYGVDRRTGYTVTIDGVVRAELEPDLPLAICRAILAERESR